MTQGQTNPLRHLFDELVSGPRGGGFVLNTGDVGLVRSLERLTAAEASAATEGGASVAAHGQHVRYGLSLMNRWAREGGNPFADAKWDEAWAVHAVSQSEWDEIRAGLNREIAQWATVLGEERPLSFMEQCGIIASVAHFAYHLGAIRQIARTTRGPREGTFAHSS